MTALDQAFIKAYLHQGEAAGAALPDSAQPVVSLADVLDGQPFEQIAQVPTDVPTTDLLEALEQPPAKTANLAALRAASQTLPVAQDDVTVNETTLANPTVPTFLLQGRSLANEPSPTLDEPDCHGLLRRLDQRISVETTLQPVDRGVPPPHIDVSVVDTLANIATPEPPLTEPAPADPSVAQPLPAEAAPNEPLGPSFHPMLQVDRFAWPNVCRQLNATAQNQLNRLAERLVTAVSAGHKVVAISSCRRGEGATTLLLCAAQRLAQHGLKVLMLDADLTQAQLGRRLGLLPQAGLEDALTRRLTLSEVGIESVDDGMTVLPLHEPTAATDETLQQLADCLPILRRHYDVILVDLGPLDDSPLLSAWPPARITDRLDAVVLVRDVRSTTLDSLENACRRLKAAGIEKTAIAENFVRG